MQASRHGSGQGFAGCHWGARSTVLVPLGHAWVGEQSVAPVTADGRHTNHCFESTARLLCAAVRLSLAPGPSDPRHAYSQTLDTPNKSDSLRHLPALAHDEACSAHPYPLQHQQRPPAARLAAMTGRPSPCSVVHTHCQFLACPITARSARCCSSAARRSPIVSHAGLITLEAALSTPSQSPPPALSLMPAVSTRCSTHTR